MSSSMNLEREFNFKSRILTFKNLSYEIYKFRKPASTILNNIDGYCQNGINAIMGPSGSGKTTLLNLLSYRNVPESSVMGQIMIDNHLLTSNFKYESGYVVQENILVATMTVRENILFSASLRLPSSISTLNKNMLVDQIIGELKLQKCAKTRVGNDLVRGISGGQKRRCSIAMELITRPSVLFLDEPTSGLDASTAISIMGNLKRLAERGCTIILSIHQPRYGIFKLFTNLILLSEGQIVYQGPANDALGYFNNLGYQCDVHNNPADFFLDIIEGNEKNEFDDDEDINDHQEQEGAPKSQFKTKLDLAKIYKESEYYNNVVKVIENTDNINLQDEPPNSNRNDDNLPTITINNGPFNNNTNNNDINNNTISKLNSKLLSKKPKFFMPAKRLCAKLKSSPYPNSFCKQLGIVSRRTILIYIRNPQIIISHCIIMLVYCLMLGWIYFRTDKTVKYGIQNRVGALYFILMNEVFISLAVIDTFIIERTNFLYEVSNGFYRVSVYFIAKIFGDLVIMKVISTTIIAVVTYWMIGFKPEFSPYLIFIVTVFILSSSANSIAFFCSATFDSGPVANHLCSVIFVFMMIFGGFFVNIKSISVLISWLKYTSIFYFANNAFLSNELNGLTFCDLPVSLTNGTNFTTCLTGSQYLTNQGILHQTPWHLWSNHIGLLIINAIFWILSYIQLRRLTKKY